MDKSEPKLERKIYASPKHDNLARDNWGRDNFAPLPHFDYNLRIGLMGGSFNPAHKGHLHCAEIAKKVGKLDEIWWLVSPKNPLKKQNQIYDFASRLTSLKQIAGARRWLRCLSIEYDRNMTITADSLGYLRLICRRAKLVWIMGADNLIQFPKWHRPDVIKSLMPIMIINRPGYHYAALASKGARVLGRPNRSPRQIVTRQKGWSFVHHAHNSQSSTALRSP